MRTHLSHGKCLAIICRSLSDQIHFFRYYANPIKSCPCWICTISLVIHSTHILCCFYGCSDAMDKYQKHMKTLAHNLFLTILSSLDLSEPEKNWAAAVYDSESNALQLNSYPACPDPTRTIGLAPHTDSLLLTILHHCETNGLQTFQDGFGWVPVHRVSGALTVNVGDLLHILSNGKFPTVCHRAVVNRTRHRISVAYFYGPRADSVVGPFSRLGLPRYRTLTLKEYIGIKAKHLDKALSLITI